MIRIHKRPSIYIPFFNQIKGQTPLFNVIPIHKTLGKDIVIQVPRYTEDLLTKVIIWEFATQDSYNLYINDSEIKRRDLYLKGYNQKNSIQYIDIIESNKNEQLLDMIRKSTLIQDKFIIQDKISNELDRCKPS